VLLPLEAASTHDYRYQCSGLILVQSRTRHVSAKCPTGHLLDWNENSSLGVRTYTKAAAAAEESGNNNKR
jgi:hypothetical protein